MSKVQDWYTNFLPIPWGWTDQRLFTNHRTVDRVEAAQIVLPQTVGIVVVSFITTCNNNEAWTMDIFGFSLGAWLAVILVILLGIVVAALLCFFLLAIHEYGHSYALTRFGIPYERINLGWPRVYTVSIYSIKHEFGILPVFGYVYAPALLKAPMNIRAWVGFAGPVASIILGIFLLGSYWLIPGKIVMLAAFGSFYLALFNLIPLPPMDGWWILEYWLARSGIVVQPKYKRVLMGIGITTIGLSVLALQYWLQF